MSTNRELFFKYKKQAIPDRVIYFALEEINGFNHLLLTQSFDAQIKDEKRFIEAMNRYLRGEMIEYIFNKAYFLDEPFVVNKNVLIPRQETEQLVLESINRIKENDNIRNITIVDLCTGSGVIGISVAKRFKSARVFLTDISSEALCVAEKNVNNNKLTNVTLLQGDILEPLIQNKIYADVIICNPPYIENIETIDKKTWEQEPHLALLAKPATYFYEKVFKDLSKVSNKQCLLCFEIGENMEESLTVLIQKYCPNCPYSFVKDIYQKTRFLFVHSKNN